MDGLTLLGTAWALAMDAFAVSASVAASAREWTPRHVFRLAWHFGLFQWGMFVAGGYGGIALSGRIATVDHWIAFGVLTLLGLRMLGASFRSDESALRYDPTRGWSLLALAVATSVDALMVGLSFGLIGLPLWTPALVVGVVTLGLAAVGCRMGRRAAGLLGPWAERLGGTALIAIGTRILLEHLGV